MSASVVSKVSARGRALCSSSSGGARAPRGRPSERISRLPQGRRPCRCRARRARRPRPCSPISRWRRTSSRRTSGDGRDDRRDACPTCSARISSDTSRPSSQTRRESGSPSSRCARACATSATAAASVVSRPRASRRARRRGTSRPCRCRAAPARARACARASICPRPTGRRWR